jgi:hypothetical protein
MDVAGNTNHCFINDLVDDPDFPAVLSRFISPAFLAFFHEYQRTGNLGSYYNEVIFEKFFDFKLLF